MNAIIVTHGNVGAALVDVALHIIGKVPRLGAVSIAWDEEPEEAIRRIENAIESALGPRSQESELLILTDMFGGTSTNVGLSFLDAGRIELITGVNLPMIIKLATLLTSDGARAPSVSEVAAQLRDQGRRSIEVASDLIEKK